MFQTPGSLLRLPFPYEIVANFLLGTSRQISCKYSIITVLGHLPMFDLFYLGSALGFAVWLGRP
jgi:hypothetical protein